VCLTPLETNNIEGVVASQTITFPEAWDNADLRLTIAGHRLQKDILLKTGHPTRFSFRIDSHTGLDYNTLQTPDFRILPPVLREPGSSIDQPLSWVVSEQGGKKILTVTLPPGNHAGKVLDPTLTLQPGATAGKDTTIVNDQPTLNYGASSLIASGEDNSVASINRTLAQFDLSEVPPDVIVSLATFTVTEDGIDRNDNERIFRVYRMLQAWTEGTGDGAATADGATWLTYNGTDNWNTAGAAGEGTDREAADTGNTNVPNNLIEGDPISFALTPSKVEDWLDGTLTNNGVLVKADTEEDEKHIMHSSDSATSAKRPKLTLEYTLAAMPRVNMLM